MRGALLLLFTLLFSCHSSPWRTSSIKSDGEEGKISRWVRSPSSSIDGMELEIVEVGGKRRAYINVHALSLPPTLTLTINGSEREFPLLLLEGEQRASLPIEALDCLLEALKLGEEVQIEAGHFFECLGSGELPAHFPSLSK